MFLEKQRRAVKKLSDATEDLTQKHGHASDSVEKLRDVLGEAKEGSKKLSDATEDLTQKHGHASDSVEKLFDVLGEAKEGSEKLSDATEDLTQKHEHASDSVEKLHLNHRALHTIMSMIGRETSPQLGHALMGAMYGPLGLVIALGAAVEEVRNKFQDYMKDLDAQGAEAAKPAFDAIKNIASEWDTAKKKMGEYMAAVAEAGKNKDAFDQQMKQDKELTDAKIEGIKKIIESLGKEEVARLQAGGASSQEIAAAEGRTKEEIDRLEDSKKDGDIARLKKELAERNAPGTQMTLDEQAQEKSAASESAAVQLKKMRNQNLKACVTAMMERGRLASSLWPSWRNLRRALMLLKVSNSPRPMQWRLMSIRRLKKNAGRKGTGRDLLNEDLEAARTEVEREKARRKQLEASMEGLEERAAAAETEAANASQAGKHNAERVAELPGLIGTGQSVNTLSNADNIIEKGVAAEDAVQKTGQVTEDQYDAINKLNELAQLSGTNMKAILSILAISHAAHGDQQKDIADIKTQFEALRARTPPAF